jgi:hypothetical protein
MMLAKITTAIATPGSNTAVCRPLCNRKYSPFQQCEFVLVRMYLLLNTRTTKLAEQDKIGQEEKYHNCVVLPVLTGLQFIHPRGEISRHDSAKRYFLSDQNLVDFLLSRGKSNLSGRRGSSTRAERRGSEGQSARHRGSPGGKDPRHQTLFLIRIISTADIKTHTRSGKKKKKKIEA